MATLRGVLVAITGLTLLAAGRAFGAGPVEQLGFALLVLVPVAVAVVRLGRHDLTVERTVSPTRARLGQPIHVTVEVLNEGKGAAPLLLLEDRLPPGLAGHARFALEGIEPKGHRKASFKLKATRRGRYAVGPLQVSFVDPFGLARVRWQALESTRFLVHPRVAPLGVPRDTGERRSLTSAARRQYTGATGEDFYTLREYVEGDDLRKIHWAATAKRARYMIRQEETPWHTRATVLIDDRAEVYRGFGESSSFERSVEAAASLCDLYNRSGYGYRLLGACTQGLPPGKGRDQLNRCLDLLAEIEPTPGVQDALVARLRAFEHAASVEAALVVVTGSLAPEIAGALTYCRRRFRQVTVVSFPAHRFGTDNTKSRWAGEQQVLEGVRLLTRAGVRAVVLGPDESLTVAWSAGGKQRSEGEPWGRKPELV